MATITRPIFLLTDFGSRDHYVGQVKAVIATIAPGCMVYDLSHEVEPFAVEEGAWLLEISVSLLPENAVVVAVVDPGVGTNRRALVVQAGGRTFLGPDNGVLSALTPGRPAPNPDPDPDPSLTLGALNDPALTPGPSPAAAGEGSTFVAVPTGLAGASGIEVRELCEPSLMRRVSSTFHARDVFGPAAAHIAAGADWRRAGPPLGEMMAFPAFNGQPAKMGVLEGHVVHVDRYGNLMTTIRAGQLFPRFALEVAGKVIDTHVRTFAEVKPGTPFCHVDSSGFLAVAMNQGNASAELGVGRGAPVRVRRR